MKNSYDVIIAGASFGGLAAASRIKSGRVLLLDQKEIGGDQTSTCCTFYSVLKAFRAERAALQIVDEVVFHTARTKIIFDLPHPFVNFDYQKFCQILFKNAAAEFIKTKVLSHEEGEVKTNAGRFKGKILVDASGWQAVLVDLQKKAVKENLNFGIETVAPYREKAIHIWYDPEIIEKGVAWIFPIGERSRIGIASYIGKTRVKNKLAKFLKRFDLRIGSLHGGFFTHKVGKPVAGKIFLVGDSAGQCLPLSGEGIRPALYFGTVCGEIINKIIKREISPEQGAGEYQEAVYRKRKYYYSLYFLQQTLNRLPNQATTLLAEFVSQPRLFPVLMDIYKRIASPLSYEFRPF